MGVTTEKQYHVHYYEVDYKKRLFVTSLVDYLGDIATVQSEELGVGIDYLKANNLGWVIYKWDIDIERYPLFGETLKIRTYAYSFRKFYGYRSFEVEDKDGNIVATAKSVWFLINTEKRRPIRVSEETYKIYDVDPDSTDSLDIPSIQKVSKVDSEKMFHVRYGDIDTNGHVNNAKYIAWIMETVPQEIMLNYSISNIKVEYIKETMYGENIQVFTEIVNNNEEIICLHKIKDTGDKELTLAQTTWKKDE